MSSFIPYQIDYSIQNAAKTLGFSKKKVLFKFGFANERSVTSGLTGPACRGSEHELLFIWSLSTGKRQLLLNNKDLHYSESGQNGWTSDRTWQHEFTLRDSAGGTFRITFVTQPVNRDIPDCRPFDLRIGGISYFRFNKIFQLGTPEMIVGHQHRGRSNHRGGDEPLSAEERHQLALAKLESLRDMEKTMEPSRNSPEKPRERQIEKQEAPVMHRVEDSLISFDDEPTPAPLPSNNQYSGHPQRSVNNFVSALTMDSGLEQTSSNLSGSFYGTPSNTNPYAPSTTNPYAPPSTNPYGVPPANNPYASSSSSQPYVSPTSNNPYAASTSSNASFTGSGSFYGASTPNPYASSSSQTSTTTPYQQQQPPATSNPYQQQATPDPSSMALTPYQGPGGSNPSPYVDAAGRLAMGQQPPQQAPPMPATTYGFSGQTPSYSGGYSNNPASNLGSPSNQSYGGQSMTSQFSYGSAPSFAQPPQQAQQQPQYPGYSTQQYNQPQTPSYGNYSGY